MKALIIGVSGQDGSYLADFLLKKGYEVFGTSRDAQGSVFQGLSFLGIKNDVHLLSMDPEDFRSVLVAIKKSKPDEIYFLAGQSSVGLSFEQPAETIQSFTIGILNVLEAVKMEGRGIKVYHAGSSEAFGDTDGEAAKETTPFKPRSPYALAKASSTWLVDNYREAYDLFACTGILFNHESPLRPARFVTQKIIQTAKRISDGSKEKLILGRLDVSRDWGWAPEYVEAMWLMMQQENPDDYIIATGKTQSLEEFVSKAFEVLGLDWKNHVAQSADLMRPTDLSVSKADPSKAKKHLGWEAKKGIQEVIEGMM
ncbi:GDP-mannose 4,6-dehydratase [Algoriphagus formosus]|uniref:GDP-mannose 4,6-dehydratase n=1 Tax=Algoriphagus formosus TaxID=2007308 RepID=A0A4R5USN5_9BACT|nr:GDP-mannose 4,6-dehydratase [Algoriphagus aquimaris]TDK42031.1 GDP-mannose 4,6-dehydratase [Algoriphagus aquimaris]